ncbi:MAG: hypothetical protein J4F39_04290 [Candidatus Latescibacteria bacterium]|nr:hypothetical protein [Candidatus Latescibacterota bacterium]
MKCNVWMAVLFWIAAQMPVQAGNPDWYLLRNNRHIRWGGSIDEMPQIRILPSGDVDNPRVVYGDAQGSLHVVRYVDGRGYEEWKSEPLGSAVLGVFVEDVDADGEFEIIAYTFTRIVLYSAEDYSFIWQIREDITHMAIANVDDDPQLELVYLVKSLGHSEMHIHVYDCLESFEQGISDVIPKESIHAQSMVIADFDDDYGLEAVLNTGVVVDMETLIVEWYFADGFGDRLGFLDIDGDGVLELIGEVGGLRHSRYLRIFNVDIQSETFLVLRDDGEDAEAEE